MTRVDLNLLVEASIADTLASLWPPFAPELILCVTILGLLLVRLLPFGRLLDPGYLTIASAAVALYFGGPWAEGGQPAEPRELFGGMIVFDSFTACVRAILFFFTILFVLLTKLSGVPDKDDGTDFYCLILGAILGMCLMASANHLLMVFLAVEMASVPSYALAGIMRGQRPASEAALKYSIYGAGAAGVMLYGISLLAGLTNTAHLPSIAVALSASVGTMIPSQQMVLVLAGLMIMVGLAFKLSAVPFHFWCPDIFEGATAEIGAFLSIASKAAALALLVRVCLGIGMLGPDRGGAADPPVAVASATGNGLFAVADEHNAISPSDTPQMQEADSLADVRQFIGIFVGVISVITMTFGNLAAYGQTNLKRLLAYSTIAHAGYMMMPVSAALAVAASSPESARDAIASILVYVAVYMFMNLGAFSIIAFLRNSMGSTEINDYAGLIRRAPVLVVCMALIMFSLVGLPPLAGFVGKFALFASLADAYQLTGKSHLIFILVMGGVNTAISLFYYLRVVRTMTIDPESDLVSAQSKNIGSLPMAYVVLMTAPVVLLIINWNQLGAWSSAAAAQLFG